MVVLVAERHPLGWYKAPYEPFLILCQAALIQQVAGISYLGVLKGFGRVRNIWQRGRGMLKLNLMLYVRLVLL
jgi:hypothetical protein